MFKRSELIQTLCEKPSEAQEWFQESILGYPLKLFYDEQKGLSLTASRNIQRGEILLKESPVTIAIENAFQNQFCSGCASALSTEDKAEWKLNSKLSCLCQGCAYNNYIADEHRNYSKLIFKMTNSKQVDTGLYALYLRYFGKYFKGRHAAADDDVICLEPQMAELLTSDAGVDSPEITSDIEAMSTLILQSYLEVGISVEELCKIIICNQHSVYSNVIKQDIGRALYPVAALLNHSCEPNVGWESSSETSSVMVCRALRDIVAGQELCIAYLSLQLLHPLGFPSSLQYREQFLMKERQFLCKCELCEEQRK